MGPWEDMTACETTVEWGWTTGLGRDPQSGPWTAGLLLGVSVGWLQPACLRQQDCLQNWGAEENRTKVK
jgi:hypothetical protein